MTGVLVCVAAAAVIAVVGAVVYGFDALRRLEWLAAVDRQELAQRERLTRALRQS